MQLRTRLSILCLTALLSVSLPLASQAGCGCDHPPPDWSVVMPPFGSPNKVITIFAEGGAFTVGESYAVDFGNTHASAAATMTDRLEVAVPPGTTPGPVALHVSGAGYDHTYPDAAFTALSNPRRVKERDGVFAARNYKAAVSADGTLLLPLNVKRVKDGMQFAFALRDLALTYGQDDVVIYNADGVDLTLFTLDVNSPQQQWGEYYGWTVEGDAGLDNDVYEGMSGESDDISRASDVFTYWRHEFHTYADAHAPGGSHEVGSTGYHPDGTLHIDHYNLIIAIQGLERDAANPADTSLATPLAPGHRTVKLGWLSIRSDNPVDLSAVVPMMGSTDDDWAEELEEMLFDDDDSD